MSQIIEGVDNEVTLTFTFLTVAAAVVIPWYFMRPERSNGRNIRSESSSNPSTTDSNRSESAPDGPVDTQGSINRSTAFETQFRPVSQETPPLSVPIGQGTGGVGFRPEYLPEESNANETTEQASREPGSLINVRVKLISDTERPFQVYSNMKLLEFKRLCFPEEFSQGKLIRFIYSGRILQPDNETLQHFNVGDGCVVHAQITQHRSNASGVPPVAVTEDLDLSAFLVPFLTLALLLGWLAVFTVDGIFTWTSILILAFLTTMMLVTSWL